MAPHQRTSAAPAASLTAMDADCIFCKIVAGEIPAQVVEQDEHTLTFMDIAPATRGHALVIPKRHAADLLEIEPDQLAAVAAAAKRQALRAHERLQADGVNLINSCGARAWQTVFHFHMHVIPRYAGDPLKLPWVPSPGDMDEIAAVAAQLR
jgi:histidine triad (HIT) family protein